MGRVGFPVPPRPVKAGALIVSSPSAGKTPRDWWCDAGAGANAGLLASRISAAVHMVTVELDAIRTSGKPTSG